MLLFLEKKSGQWTNRHSFTYQISDFWTALLQAFCPILISPVAHCMKLYFSLCIRLQVENLQYRYIFKWCVLYNALMIPLHETLPSGKQIKLTWNPHQEFVFVLTHTALKLNELDSKIGSQSRWSLFSIELEQIGIRINSILMPHRNTSRSEGIWKLFWK